MPKDKTSKKHHNSSDVVGTIKIRTISPKIIVGEVIEFVNNNFVVRVKRKRSKLYTNQVISMDRLDGIFTLSDKPVEAKELVGSEVTFITKPEAEILTSPSRTGVGAISVNSAGFTVCNTPDGTFMVSSTSVDVDSDVGAEVGAKRTRVGRKKGDAAAKEGKGKRGKKGKGKN